MTLFWPGDDRAGDHLTPRAFLEAVVDVEEAWLAVLGVEGASLHADLDEWLEGGWGRDIESAATRSSPWSSSLRTALEADQPEAARWLHRGLTSQDVVDSALMTMVRDAVAEIVTEQRRLVRRLAELAQSTGRPRWWRAP